MIVFPNCKINLGLIITGKREDGFHNIETAFLPIPLKDALEILPTDLSTIEPGQGTNRDNPLNNEVAFISTGITIEGNSANNLCVKAYSLLKKDFPHLPPTRIHLHKAIPIGAGLGGGSSNAAFTLMALNEKYGLGLSQAQLISYAIQLGSDCPFFVINQPCLGYGRGELLEPVSLNLSQYQLILINPGIHIDTGWAFSQLNKTTHHSTKSSQRNPLKHIINQSPATWKDTLHNEFEPLVFDKYPEVKSIQESLYENGAIYAAMSGSGSSIYGLYDRNVKITVEVPGHYLRKQLFL